MDREYTLQELRHQYGTGRACHVSGRGKSKVMDYRFGADQGYLNPQWWGYERFQKMCAAIRDEEIDTSKKV